LSGDWHRRRRGSIDKRLGRLLKSFAVLTGSAGVLVLGLQLLGWFKHGFWTPRSLLDLWLWLGNSYSLNAASGTGRLGLRLLDLPLAPSLLAIALVLFAAGARIAP
jgi:hypothetical protein